MCSEAGKFIKLIGKMLESSDIQFTTKSFPKLSEIDVLSLFEIIHKNEGVVLSKGKGSNNLMFNNRKEIEDLYNSEKYLINDRKEEENESDEFFKRETNKDGFLNKPKTEKRVNRTFIIALLGLGLAALTLMNKLMCNTQHQP